MNKHLTEDFCQLTEFSHADDFSKPTASSSSSSSKPKDFLASVDSSVLQPCKYGANCYRKNLLHFAEYSHPIAVTSKVGDDASDTDHMYDSDDDKKVNNNISPIINVF
jgi:aprataxin and PNK-like factor